MSYVNGFVAAVPNENKANYIEHSKIAGEIMKRHGALKMVECWGDDVPEGEVTSFPMAVKCEPGETVVFSWAIWPSKDVHDQGMPKVMQDMQTEFANNPPPFDGKRLIFGSFDMIVDV